MLNTKSFNATIIFSLAATILLSASCAMISPADPVRALEEKAVEFAQVLNANDMDRHYYYMSPEFRETHSIEHFKSRKRPVYTNVKFVRIDWQDATHATAYYTADMDLMAFKFAQTRIHFPFELTPDGWFLKYKDFYNSL